MKINTKIIATIGPSCNDKKTLKSMLNCGVDVLRLNMSHGDKTSKKDLYNLINSLDLDEASRPAILADLSGPKIRVTNVKNDFTLEKGQTVIITNQKTDANDSIQVTRKVIFTTVNEGANILINDGRIKLEVEKLISENSLKCTTLIGGEVEIGKGVNFPGVTLDVPALTDQDILDLNMALEEDADWIALSFVRNAKDIIGVHKIMDKFGKRLPVMAKIEKWEALDDLKNITEAFDGLMVARGDLGVEIPASQVPLAQKKIIKLGSSMGKPVVIATQLLESMVNSHTPTRAEVSDIANAIFDNADALMVTGETAAGKYPIEVVKTLRQIIKDTEDAVKNNEPSFPKKISKTADAISHGVWQIAKDLDINIIMTMTHSGSTARMIARYRPQANIIALTPFKKIARQLRLVWGVMPIKVAKYDNVELLPNICNSILEELNITKKGDQFVITGGVPMGIAGTTNYLSIQIRE